MCYFQSDCKWSDGFRQTQVHVKGFYLKSNEMQIIPPVWLAHCMLRKWKLRNRNLKSRIFNLRLRTRSENQFEPIGSAVLINFEILWVVIIQFCTNILIKFFERTTTKGPQAQKKKPAIQPASYCFNNKLANLITFALTNLVGWIKNCVKTNTRPQSMSQFHTEANQKKKRKR